MKNGGIPGKVSPALAFLVVKIYSACD